MNKPTAFSVLLCVSFLSFASAAPNQNSAGVSLELSGMPAASHVVQTNAAGMRLELADTPQPAPEGAFGSGAYVYLGCFGPVTYLVIDLTLTVERLRDYLMGQITLTVQERLSADLNGDGRIDIADLIYLLNSNNP